MGDAEGVCRAEEGGLQDERHAQGEALPQRVVEHAAAEDLLGQGSHNNDQQDEEQRADPVGRADDRFQGAGRRPRRAREKVPGEEDDPQGHPHGEQERDGEGQLDCDPAQARQPGPRGVPPAGDCQRVRE
jgi:hypothetical protein